MIRPKSVIWFERCYLASTLFGAIVTAMTWKDAVQSADGRQVREMFGPSFMPLLFVFLYTLWLVLWYFTARAGSGIARWVVVIFCVLGLGAFAMSLSSGLPPLNLPFALTIASLALTAASIWFLFRPDANAWFARAR